MKKLILALACIALCGCEPMQDESTAQAPASDSSRQQTAASEATQKAISAVENYKAQPNIRVNEIEVMFFSNSSNFQTVKRVEDKDAVCWVTYNTKNYDSNISCIPRSQLTVSTSTSATTEDAAPVKKAEAVPASDTAGQ